MLIVLLLHAPSHPAGGYVTDEEGGSSKASSAASSVDRNEGKKKGKRSRKPSVGSIDENKGLMSEEMDRDLESGQTTPGPAPVTKNNLQGTCATAGSTTTNSFTQHFDN